MPEKIEVVREIEDDPDEKVEIVRFKKCNHYKTKSKGRMDLSRYNRNLEEVEVSSGEAVHLSWPREGCKDESCS